MFSRPTVNIPIADNKLSVNFPNKCIYCASLAETTRNIEVSDSITNQYQGRGSTVITQTTTHSMNIPVPYCRNHSELSERNDKTLTRLFGFGFLAALLPILFGIFSSMTFSDFLNEIWSSGLAGCLMGVLILLFIPGVVGILFRLLPRIFPFLFKNKSLQHQTGNIFGHGGALGITINYSEGYNGLNFVFTNPEITQEFAHLNNAKIIQVDWISLPK